MSTQSTVLQKYGIRYPFKLARKSKLALGYLCLMSLPFLATFSLDMANQGAYATVLTTMNTLAMMAFYMQFPLVSRLKKIALFSNIDWNVTHIKKSVNGLVLFSYCIPYSLLLPDLWCLSTTACTAWFQS